MAKSWTSREIKTLRRSLHDLATAFEALGDALGRVQKAATNGTMPTPSRRTTTITPRRRAALMLQGKYMGMMRGMKPRQAARIKKMRAAKGYEAAIRAATR